jgi:hypothetical protein
MVTKPVVGEEAARSQFPPECVETVVDQDKFPGNSEGEQGWDPDCDVEHHTWTATFCGAEVAPVPKANTGYLEVINCTPP